MVMIRALGACEEVGRSAFLIENDSAQVLLDYGISMKGSNRLPLDVIPKDLKAIILSHAHVDHSGGLPYLYISGNAPCFMTKATKDLIKVLLPDTLAISGSMLPYEEIEIKKLMKYIQLLSFGRDEVNFKHNDFKFKLLDAGHIPGSSMVILNIEGKNILYTGDLNTRDTRLLWGANNKDIPPLDAVIIESTYAATTHPPRVEVEKQFVSAIKDVLSNKGKILIPAFGVARSQEILSILQAYGLTQEYNIAIDGMARSISRVFLKDTGALRTTYSLDRVNIIKSSRGNLERMRALKNSDIIITPSGMLKGGPVRFYAPHILQSENNGLFLVSYQVEGTPGRILLDEKRYEDNNFFEGNEAEDMVPKQDIEVKARIESYDFSSHCDGNDLINFLSSLTFKTDGAGPKVLCVHGDRENCIHLEKRINEEIKGVQAFTPKLDDTFEI
ncbi:MAG: MBL fold metallo-hydrolase [Promethearchaeota archaeon]